MLDQRSNTTLLNVLGCDFMNARCMTDKLSIGKPEIDFYTVNGFMKYFNNYYVLNRMLTNRMKI